MRILVVEDEHKLAQSIKRGLEQETYAVDLAHNGSDGYDLASTEDYDLIILDIMLPEMNGLEICTKLREQKIHTPILFLSAKSEMEDKVLGLDTGADDYLTKPFSFEELLARIRALLRRPNKPEETVLTYKGLILNTNTHMVSREGQNIVLSKKEYALLEYMLRNKEKVLTKDQIITHVWSYDADVLENTVEQYMKYLRTKIDKPFPNKKSLIQTIRGFGYILKEEN